MEINTRRVYNIHTNYSNLSNEELLREVDAIRQFSPIIQELCIRLEEVKVEEEIPGSCIVNTDCPICKTFLSITVDITR